MFARVYTGGLVGVDAYRIEVEVDCGCGIGQIHIVGLPDTAIKEAQERVRAAIKSCDFFMPSGKKWIVNLAPADTRKEGPAFDLPIAVGILSATGFIPPNKLEQFWMIGELGLDGAVRGTPGILPLAASCKAHGMNNIIVPEANAHEANLVDDINVFPVSNLRQVLSIVNDPAAHTSQSVNPNHVFQQQNSHKFGIDFADVKGQQFAKRALTIAAAGRHNTLMVGSPGSGKSMLAQRLPTILPPLDFQESIELTKLYSVGGLLSAKGTLITQRPFRAPHHSASISGLVGGGTHPRPGEISLSHLGVLFLDELTEFPRSHIDALRQPLETGMVTISRAHQTLSYPANFLLVGACNPCPCGFRGDSVRFCACTQWQADRYWNKLSGPFLDRVDLHIEVSRLSEQDLLSTTSDTTSESMRLQVQAAVQQQRSRFPTPADFVFNGQLTQQLIKQHCQIDQETQTLLARAITQLSLSARAYDRTLRIARTIADLDQSENIKLPHIAEALRYRTVRTWTV